MLADAIAAERFRLWRDRVSLFWGFGFMPLATMLFSVAGDLFVHFVVRRTIPGETTDLANRAMGAVAGASGPITALFLLIGAAAIFAGDYRWETWRLITPRNSRLNLLAAKLIVFGEAVAWSLLATAIAAVLGGLFGSVVNHTTLVGPPTGPAFVGQYAGVTLVTWLEILLIGGLAAVIGVQTRSTLGAVIAGLVVVFAQSTLAATQHATTWKSLAIPAYAGRVLKTFMASPAEARPEAGPAGLALVLLLVWLVVLAGGAAVLFRRQDLTRNRVMRAEILLLVIAFAYVSWQLYRALGHGSVPAVRTLEGFQTASRADHPILYWMFTGLLGVIWLFLAATIISMIAPGLLPTWLTP